ncbi:MAG: hydrogenase 3 maturation endopeptidase HyCI [Candidatus Omnitrophica bacterium]|nr:hydrogenase 3 maturation endopeptidase HyCI [Candidatus Omnitrophota bacterium]
MNLYEHLKAHLHGKVVILGIGNTLRGDDAAGSLLAQRLHGKVPYTVYDAGTSPENYLGKIIRDKPDNIVIIDAADFAGKPGEFDLAEDIETTNLFSTHDASIALTINYLKNNLKVDIITLIVQPGSLKFGTDLTPSVAKTLEDLEKWFRESA